MLFSDISEKKCLVISRQRESEVPKLSARIIQEKRECSGGENVGSFVANKISIGGSYES